MSLLAFHTTSTVPVGRCRWLFSPGGAWMSVAKGKASGACFWPGRFATAMSTGFSSAPNA